ncbi:hypothetical protein HPNQ4044_1684 [Helicobacter pylori NQ4044]|uniref:Uncharacterized protein n=1 Tax=Helicobacter pylori NQ4044 TaxID=992028 RepID=J0J237_HELPX|nr:hypothetical protein HPNQ4044_1684 [Helicobacter pylori NQ4044]
MRRGFLDRLCCFCAFRVIVNLYALFVCKKLFLAVVFSYSNTPQHPKIQALLS